ncbi:MAG: circularly permuted type 2 ATP-grasp protein [Phycisphaerales bacterium]|jgi:uncharacterized circularly permuted ATP-grasp superfamily protein
MYIQGLPRPHYQGLHQTLSALGADELRRRQAAADMSFLHQGITFTVYGDQRGTEKIFPYDVLPRLIPANEWDTIQRGLAQRLIALNLFLKDVYHEGRVFDEGIVPRELIWSCKHFRREMRGVNVPRDVYVTVCGSDLIRMPDGRFAVLEDNLRVPSGVSYMLANRQVMKRVFPAVFKSAGIQPIDHYAQSLLTALRALARPDIADPHIVLLTPGVFNSAYFEHAFLARQMGIQLVEGRDLLVHEGVVYCRTTEGLRRVDVIYRRIDDDFVDPVVFRRDSQLGVPGLFAAIRMGNVAVANAVGNGVADDKAVYAYVPRLIRFYLKQDPILPNIDTYLMEEADSRAFVLDRLHEMVVKAVGESGGYGMLIGPHATTEQREEFRKRIIADPRNYIAQPTISLSHAPCFINGSLESRHVDLRVYVICSGSVDKVVICPGGLTRVALKKGSLVVNSSQGGGSKDTWVLSPGHDRESIGGAL